MSDVNIADKETARSKVAWAVENGRLKREPCEVCGEPDVEAHHDDYSKPLDVRWLCPTHHRAWHRKNGKPPGLSSRTVATRLPRELAEKVYAVAEAEQRTASNVVRAIVSIALEGVEPGPRTIEQLRHRLAASQDAPDGDLPASQRRDGEDPAARRVRPISRRESAR